MKAVAVLLLPLPALILNVSPSAGQAAGSPADKYKVVQKSPINAFLDDIKIERVTSSGIQGLNYRVSVTVAKDAFEVGETFTQGVALLDGDVYMVVQKTHLKGTDRGDVKISRVVAWYKHKPAIKGLSYIVSVTVPARDLDRYQVRDLVRRQAGTIRGLTQDEQNQVNDPAGRGQLVIENIPMFETNDNYLRYIRFLTVPPDRQTDPAFTAGTDVAAIKKLEDPLRRQIYEGMNNNVRGQFIFGTLKAAQENFDIRLSTIAFMRKIQKGPPGLNFGYYTADEPPGTDDPNWETTKDPQGAGGYVFDTRSNTDAYTAIHSLVQHRFRGDCLAAVEICIFQAVAGVLREDRFKALHPDGLHKIGLPVQFADGVSIYKDTVTVGDNIGQDAMVPGDWVYMQNKPDYHDWWPNGYWTGENGLYMGKYTLGGAAVPQYDSAAPLRFSGMGLYDVTEAQLRARLKAAYNGAAVPSAARQQQVGHKYAPATDADIQWKLLGRPNPKE
jgi:hypothetical protein